MGIDEVIKQARKKADKNSTCWKHCTDIKNCTKCKNENKQIAEWLEELKEARKGFEENRKAGYKHGYSDGYAEAIDEFAEKIALETSESIIWDMLATMGKNSSLSDTSDKIIDYVIDNVKRIAVQMKGGGKDA